MKTIHAHNLLFSIAIITVIATALLYFYTLNSVNSSSSGISAIRKIVLSEEENMANLRLADDVFSKTADGRDQLKTFFIPADKPISFIENLEGIGARAQSDVSLSSVSSNNPGSLSPGSFSKITAHVEAIGSWTATIKTLRLAETLPYQVSLSKIRLGLSGTEKSTKESSWQLSFEIASDTIFEKVATTSAVQ